MKRKGLKIIIFVLVLLLGVSVAYIGYDKFVNKDDNVTNNNIEELKKDFQDFKDYDELGLIVYFENYIKHMPQRYVNSKLKSYKTSELTDEEISMFVWRYISQTAGIEHSLSVDEVDTMLKNYLDLDNYQVKEMKAETTPTPGQPWHIYGLKKENDKYVISVIPTEVFFAKYRVKEIEYDSSSKQIIVHFDIYSEGYWITKDGEGKVVLQNNGIGSFNIVEVIINN